MSRLLLAVSVLAAAGCTLDYQGLLDGAGGSGAADGGGSSTTAAGTTAATGGGAGPSTTGGSTGDATTTTGATSGGGAGGGDGGAGGGGGGGSGGAPPGVAPCGLAIEFADDESGSLGERWVEDNDGGSIAYDEQTGMTSSLDGAPDDPERTAIRSVDEEAISGCSVTVAVTAIEPTSTDDGYVGAFVGAADQFVGVVVVVSAEQETSCLVVHGSLAEEEPVAAVPCGDGGPQRQLRIRHTGTQLCYDQGSLEGPLEPLGWCVDMRPGQQAFVGAAATMGGEVTIGSVQ